MVDLLHLHQVLFTWHNKDLSTSYAYGRISRLRDINLILDKLASTALLKLLLRWFYYLWLWYLVKEWFFRDQCTPETALSALSRSQKRKYVAIRAEMYEK